MEPSAIVAAGSDEWVSHTHAFQLSEYIADRIDVTGASSTIRRSLRLTKRAGVEYLSHETIFVTVEIEKE